MAFKWKSVAEKQAESAAAANWNNLVSKIKEQNPEAKDADISPESILESIESSASSDDPSGLQSKINSLQEEINGLKSEKQTLTESNTTLTSANEALQTQVDNLLDGAGASSAVAAVKSEKELDAKGESLAAFADKHAGDTNAILAMCKETGLI